MQTRISFDDREKIKLKQPINKEQLINAIKDYFNKLTDEEIAIKAAIDLIKDTHDLDKAVDIINNNDLDRCENEFTTIIRKPIILELFFLAFAESCTLGGKKEKIFI